MVSIDAAWDNKKPASWAACGFMRRSDMGAGIEKCFESRANTHIFKMLFLKYRQKYRQKEICHDCSFLATE
jgi:hypothetical protein